jgi:hypothetical protein
MHVCQNERRRPIFPARPSGTALRVVCRQRSRGPAFEEAEQRRYTASVGFAPYANLTWEPWVGPLLQSHVGAGWMLSLRSRW